MPEITPEMAGTWLEGCHGWTNNYRAIDRAEEFGFVIPPEYAEALADYRENGPSAHEGSWEAIIGRRELCDMATDYLESLAPEGFTFEWDAGELSLIPEFEQSDDWEWTTGICTDGTGDAQYTVSVNKVGGGTLGRAYEGLWEFRVSEPDSSDRTLWFGRDLNTGTPKTHMQAALDVADFFDSLETGVIRCPCCGDDAMGTIGRACSDCHTAGCEPSRDGCGELGYFECQRADMEDSDD